MHYFEEKAHGIYAACVIGILLCILSIFLLQRQYVLNLIVENIGFKREKYFGDLIFDLYKKELKIIDNKKSNAELKNLVDLLRKNNDFEDLNLQFYIIDDDSINAAAMMGGHIIVNKGLILKSDNSDQLLAVMAHEIAHVKNRDVLKSIFSQIGVLGFFTLFLGDVSSIIDDLMMASSQLVNLKFSRDVEFAADREAVNILANAGVSCDALLDFFTSNDLGEEVMISRAEFLLTHPVSKNRANKIKQQIARNNSCEEVTKAKSGDLLLLQSLLN